MSTIWENTYGCAKKYICASELYLISVILQCYSVIMDWGISSSGHGTEVVDILNYIDTHYIYKLMSSVQLPGSKQFDYQMQVPTSIQNIDVSLDKEFQ